MIFNRFHLNVILLATLMGITSFVFVWTLGRDYLVIGKFWIVVLWLIELIVLIRYVNKTNSSLLLFLNALKSSDSLRKHRNADALGQLNLSYNQIIEIVKQTRLDQHSQYLYFQHTLEHISTGIISFKKNGSIDLFNRAAQKILNTNKLENINEIEGLSAQLGQMKDGKDTLIHLKNPPSEQRVLIRASRFILMNEEITLLSMQNIKKELDTEEQNAWQKLIRVLTHEIMNSIGPMKSITNSTLSLYLKDNSTKKAQDISDEIIEDTVLGLQTINERQRGLMSFVRSYKRLLKVPAPVKGDLHIDELFQKLEQLFREDFSNNKIRATFNIDKAVGSINADETLLSQVFINLIKNAMEALEGLVDKRIEVSAYCIEDTCHLEVSDNGKGMSEEVKSQIFIPFYSTKSEGDGIGLSLSRQIILAHKGDITAISEPGQGATLSFRI